MTIGGYISCPACGNINNLEPHFEGKVLENFLCPCGRRFTGTESAGSQPTKQKGPTAMDKLKRDLQLLDDAVPGEKTSRYLSCELNSDEQLDRAVQMTNAFDEAVRLKAEAKGVADEFKSRIMGAEQQHNALKNAVQTRREYREVDCTDHYDYKKGKVYTVRDDLGLIAESRNMTPDERQKLIPGMEVLPGVTLESVTDATSKKKTRQTGRSATASA